MRVYGFHASALFICERCWDSRQFGAHSHEIDSKLALGIKPVVYDLRPEWHPTFTCEVCHQTLGREVAR